MATEQLSLFETEVKKRCTKCGELKGLDEFYNLKRNKDGKDCKCKNCWEIYRKENKVKQSEYCKQYYKDNRDRLKSKALKYSEDNREAIKVKHRAYYEKNKDRISKKNGKRYFDVVLKDPKQQIKRRLSKGIRKSLVDGKQGRSWESMVDYNVDDLVKHFKKKDMDTWKKFVKNPSDYHIDHIIPVDVFNFKTKNCIDFNRCWGMKNLQLLPALDNLSKRNKIDKPFQPSFSFV